MMKRLFGFIPVYVFPLAVLFSCTAPIDINTRDSEPVIVIYGCLTDENKHQSVRITSSSPYFDNKENSPVADANVQIEDSEGNVYDLSYGENGYYFSKSRFAVRSGATYHLRVDVDFDKDGTPETYESVTTVSPVLTIDSINVKPLNIMGYRHFALNVFAQDPPGVKDFYLFRFYINDSLSNNQISNYIVTDDEFFDGSYLENTIYYFEDITDENVVEKNKDNDNIYMVSPGDRIRLQALNIEEGYYKFINECTSEMRGENPMFGGPPSNISTNLTNGAVGYFTGYC
ncbi:MAG: DUF4249 domain-containing protein, partial [Tannerella sp.]|nr:DUF4249 domain-containing protein [Tannerella sp.]